MKNSLQKVATHAAVSLLGVLIVIYYDYISNDALNVEYSRLIIPILVMNGALFVLTSKRIENLGCYIGSLFLVTVALIDSIITISTIVSGDWQAMNLDFKVIYLIGASILIGVLYMRDQARNKTLTYYEGVNDRLDVLNRSHELSYFTYDVMNEEINIDISQRFVEKYELDYKTLALSVDQFLSVLHPDDYHRASMWQRSAESGQLNEFVDYFRVKYPQMHGYCLMYINKGD